MVNFDKKLYICLYGYTYPNSAPIMQVLSKAIVKVTKSDRTHAAWGIDLSSGEFKELIGKGVQYNNIRTGEGQLAEQYNYVVFSFPVTEEEYLAACELYQEPEKGTMYNPLQLLQIAADKLIHPQFSVSTRQNFDAFQNLENGFKAEVCSSYVALCLSKLSWRLNKLIIDMYGNHKLVAPADLLRLPGIIVEEQSLGLNFSYNNRTKKTYWR